MKIFDTRDFDYPCFDIWHNQMCSDFLKDFKAQIFEIFKVLKLRNTYIGKSIKGSNDILFDCLKVSTVVAS